MIRRALIPGCLLLLCAASAADAQGIAIDHKEVGCIVVGKYPKMNACFTPAASLARSRVYFRPEGTPSWYYVDMKTDQPCFTGILPRPGKKLVGKKIEYYVEAQDKTFNPARTAEYGPVVVQSAQECKKDVPVAPFVNNATVAVFPSVPAGFVGGGIGTAAVIGVAAAGAAAAGTAAVVASGDDDDTTTTTVVVVINPTTTTTTLAPTTTTTTPPRTNRPPFAVLTTNPDPPSGNGPLAVTFDLCKSTDPDGDPLSFFFDFGDGGKASGSCLETHTYSSSFRSLSNGRAFDRSYSAEVCVVDPGGLSACRTRSVNATEPPPLCTAPTVVLSPPPDFFNGCSGDVAVQATASNADSVTFCAESDPSGPCSGPPFAGTSVAAALPPACVSGTASGNQYSATLTLVDGCNKITANAMGCGTASSTGYSFYEDNCFRAASGGPGRERSASWTSDLTVEGGRLQIVVNGGSPVFPGRGRGTGTASLVNGENRVEAVLVETAGKAGLWRVDLKPAESIVAGSLRVVSGEAVLLGASSATFRLSGREGERIVFTFLKR